jgi:hypothetical protein
VDAGAVPSLVHLLSLLEQTEVMAGDIEAELSKARAVQHVLLALARCVHQHSSAQQECVTSVSLPLRLPCMQFQRITALVAGRSGYALPQSTAHGGHVFVSP